MDNINFKARCIANTSNVYKKAKTHIDIYELSNKDNNFIKKLGASVDYKKLMPELCDYYQFRWQKVFNYAVESALNKENKAYLAVSNNKPCGIMTFYEHGNNIVLDSICDIPQNNGRRVNYTGSTLICLLYQIAQRLNVKGISLSAVTDGPIDVVAKYIQKGFKITEQDEVYTQMYCSKYKFKEKLAELLENISYRSINNTEEVSLDGII